MSIHAIVKNIKYEHDGWKNFKINVVSNEGAITGFLQPITFSLASQESIQLSLTKWRKMFMKYFLTQFEPSVERTACWLKDYVVPSNDRILFLICDNDGRPVGNFGVCNIRLNSAELDNLIRGEKGGHPELIYFAEVALLKWLYTQFDLADVSLHVFSNNARTISLHERAGFRIYKEETLWKTKYNDEITYSTSHVLNGKLVDFTYLEMHLPKDEFYSCMTKSGFSFS